MRCSLLAMNLVYVMSSCLDLGELHRGVGRGLSQHAFGLIFRQRVQGSRVQSSRAQEVVNQRPFQLTLRILYRTSVGFFCSHGFPHS